MDIFSFTTYPCIFSCCIENIFWSRKIRHSNFLYKNPQSSPCSPHPHPRCLVVFFPMRCNRKESNLTNSKHPLPLHRCLQAKSYHFHLKPFSPTHSFSWHQRRLMPNGRLSSRRGVLQLPRSSGRCSSRSSALRFPPSFFHSLRHTCPQCNLVHRGF